MHYATDSRSIFTHSFSRSLSTASSLTTRADSRRRLATVRKISKLEAGIAGNNRKQPTMLRIIA